VHEGSDIRRTVSVEIARGDFDDLRTRDDLLHFQGKPSGFGGAREGLHNTPFGWSSCR
jgi:hypothetical protein